MFRRDLRKSSTSKPYAKSLAAELYPDSIAVDDAPRSAKQIPFMPFVGISPRKYLELFTAGKRKERDGGVVIFAPQTALPKFTQEPGVYLENEVGAFKNLILKMKEKRLLIEVAQAMEC